ncbi:integrin alpha N-terminal domain-containing protein [Basidiobolus meristosporus CBS 931.73]|uniref:Integrin alpha N-terminal domain-containing protein n=1 Tax=Basidiobolus meristosporus CBS 931.73 TaxID=1314790 RepID=A0A1Y1YMD2_9FUNG|nr:integrin alpha N-terminal domain-containing protein [Basidiobolus meristosporus CBS 931.73]|eukprot:ORX98916.1 integrin alpha N-terminal domain-containing protein [Basidiobolus meristosporus CBS 931.73]
MGVVSLRFSLLLFLFSAILPLGTLARPKFSTNGLHRVDVGLGEISGTVVAFGDINEDKFTDLFVLSGDQSTLSFYLWHHEQYKFVKTTSEIKIDPNGAEGFVITNVVAGDFNYDGKLDVLLMGQKDPGKAGDVLMRVYFGNGENDFSEAYTTLPPATSAQPVTLDYDGDMRTDLIGYPASNPGQLSVWKNTGTNDPAKLFEITPFTPVGGQACKISNPHSNAFIDLDGDCLADLFITCKDTDSSPVHFQIWTNNKNGQFKLGQEGDLPNGAGPVSFADMDGDGTMDMVFPVCPNNDACEIHIVYNQQMPLCAKSNQGNCRKVGELCQPDVNFKFDLGLAEDNPGHVAVALKDLGITKPIMTSDANFNGILPVPLRIGDYNLDGHPDVLLVTTEGKDSSKMYLLQNEPCKSGRCSQATIDAKRRTMVLVSSGLDDLNAIPNPKAGAFFDLDEDGTLDFLVLSPSNSDTRLASRNANVLYNNFFNDAFFMKTLVLNGVCPSWCGLEETHPNTKPYGVSYPGATFKYTVIDTNGNKRATQVSQLFQSGYCSLQTPYNLFGLGRTNNYIENLFVGTTRNQTKHYNTWQGVIPNSQLIIIPYQPEDTVTPSSWSLELYISPSGYAKWVLLVMVVTMVVLSIIIYILARIEKKEDELERRKDLHIINFDAL